jgi:hypothetical protein
MIDVTVAGSGEVPVDGRVTVGLGAMLDASLGDIAQNEGLDS